MTCRVFEGYLVPSGTALATPRPEASEGHVTCTWAVRTFRGCQNPPFALAHKTVWRRAVKQKRERKKKSSVRQQCRTRLLYSSCTRHPPAPRPAAPPVQTDGTGHSSRWSHGQPDRCSPPVFPFLPAGGSVSYQVFNLGIWGGRRGGGGGWRQSAKNLSGTESFWLMQVLCLRGLIACFFGRLCWSSGPSLLLLTRVSYHHFLVFVCDTQNKQIAFFYVAKKIYFYWKISELIKEV